MAVPGYETVIEYGNAATYSGSSVWTDICSELVEIEFPTQSSDDIETSHMLTADQIRTFMAGWSDSGEVSFTANYSAAEYSALQSAYRDTKGYRIVLSNGTGVQFNGYLKEIGGTIDMEGLVQVTGVIKITGDVDDFSTT